MRGWDRVVAAALLLPALGACSREEPGPAGGSTATEVEAIRFEDLLFDPADRESARVRHSAVRECRDESHMSIVLKGGERRRFQVELEDPATLLVGGCIESGPLEPGQGLRVVIGERRRRREVETFRFDQGWETGRIEVQPRPKRRLQVQLVADVAADARIYVSDLVLERRGTAPAPPAVPRAILISLDAFREDAIGAISARTRTPHLDRLLAESERFLPHWAAEISTKPSHASMLTGLPVEVHGSDRSDTPVGEEVDTLAERLSRAGVSTGALASIAPYFHPRYGLAQGFDDYRLLVWSTHQELRAATDWATRHRDRPSFLFVHLYGVHSDFRHLPYEASGVTRRTVEELFGVPDYGCSGGRCASGRLLAINFGEEEPIPREAEILRFLYERGVETLDAELGRFFDQLRRAGLWDDTLIVVTADHGEQFGEHGYFLHTTAHEETLRVPLIVKWPNGRHAGRTTELPSTSLDLAPTLLAHFGLPSDDLIGRDLAQPPAPGRTVMVSRYAVRLDDWKLLLATGLNEEALYDLGDDPRERSNLLGGRGEIAERLIALRKAAVERARTLLGREIETERQPFSEEEIERLRSLGYLQ